MATTRAVLRGFLAVGIAGLGVLAAAAEAGGASATDTCPAVTCTLSTDRGYCACRAGGEICAGQQAVAACTERFTNGTCCVAAGFCYCTEEPQCWAPDDVPTDRCDAKLALLRSCAITAHASQ